MTSVLTPTQITSEKTVSSWQVRPCVTTGCLILSDIASVLIAAAAGVISSYLDCGVINISHQLRYWPVLCVCLLVYALTGMYSGASLDYSVEFRRLATASFLILGGLALVMQYSPPAASFLTPGLLLEITFSFICLAFFRNALRSAFGNTSWWGFPVVVFGVNPEPSSAPKGLQRVALIPGQGVSEVIANVLNSRRPTYALVTSTSDDVYKSLAEFSQSGVRFSRIIYIPEKREFPNIWIRPRVFSSNSSKSFSNKPGRNLSAEVARVVLMKQGQLAKRFLDLAITMAFAFAAIPLSVLIAIAIRFDSRGPVLFSQLRIGRGGRAFVAWKFRTMVVHGEYLLRSELERNPSARTEWALFHKLRSDPRVTRVGKFLRRTSLDELPQLWNVLKGDMSLVGPRPILPSEVEKYGTALDLYTRVQSGLTGLWQVSGRSETSYQERIRLDGVYVRNWSVWLDVSILFQTIATVLLRKGAF